MQRGRIPGGLCRFSCFLCGTVESVSGGSHKFRCFACRAQGLRGVLASPHWTGKEEAGKSVAGAIRDGLLPHPRGLACADCGGTAVEYEHRDYGNPLRVVPICRSCNLLRGPAAPMPGRIEALVANWHQPYRLRRSAEKMLRAMGLPTDVLADMPPKLALEDWRRIAASVLALPG